MNIENRRMKKTKLLIIIFAVIVFSAACSKIKPISAIPSIEFISFEVFDTIEPNLQNNVKGGKLIFKFKDGDGDIGIPSSDSISTNFELTLYRKINGEMQLVTDSSDFLLPGSNYRIPYLEPIGQSQILSGEISILLLYPSYKPTDTIKYHFNIIDRAGNISNTEETAEIIVAQNDVYKK